MTSLVVILGLALQTAVNGFEGWIDPDTHKRDYEVQSLSDGRKYDLVMSDEFNRDGRSFTDGHDPKWTALDKSDDDQTASGRKSLQYYNSTNIHTEDGKLVITTTTQDTIWRGYNPYKKKIETMKRHFRSGMVQSWNKFCYTGGILEVDVQFPGKSDIGGLWPAVWLLGNLGRATFEASTNLMWPWSHPGCDRTQQRAQEISGCDITTHFDLNRRQGRGATEIDLIEVMAGPKGKLPIVKNNLGRPYNSMTLQLAPGIPAKAKRPQAGTLPEWGFTWYSNITYGHNVSINPFFYGTHLAPTSKNAAVTRTTDEAYQCDAIGAMAQLNDSHFNSMHTYRLEWQPGPEGYLHWYMDGMYQFGIEAESLQRANEATQIPNEPSYVILNTAISTSWGFPNPPPGCTTYDCKVPGGQCGMNSNFCKMFPAQFLIDYVRVYQDKNDSRQTVGCNPPDYPTRKFIAGHEYRYKRPVDRHALKSIVTGGAKCVDNSECGEGLCSARKCKCNPDWQGPRCLVPTYRNDFPAWDTDEWAFFEPIFVPKFLIYSVALIALGVVVLVGSIVYQRRYEKKNE